MSRDESWLVSELWGNEPSGESGIVGSKMGEELKCLIIKSVIFSWNSYSILIYYNKISSKQLLSQAENLSGTWIAHWDGTGPIFFFLF